MKNVSLLACRQYKTKSGKSPLFLDAPPFAKGGVLLEKFVIFPAIPYNDLKFTPTPKPIICKNL